ncbi:cation:proton antiporter [Actinomadura sp. 1N219]|uniref:cation:proton antiporter n=1 Tax=Actinomadura sp. 1N219 TaxID=3375152 RepID=UPI0037A1BF1A
MRPGRGRVGGANLRPIVSLSVLLVLVTAFAVGGLVTLVVPGMPLAVGMVLGAAVAPPDPVAALSIGRRAGLPPRLITLIEGEGLLNDATALTTYQVAVAAAVGGGFSWAVASGRFALAVAGGLVVGVLVALAIRAARPWLGDPLIANAVSLAAPFVAYLLAEEIHSSGVLAVVVAGLMVGHDAGREETGASRLQTGAVWQFVEFLLEGLVFLLIGQQLPSIWRGLQAQPVGDVIAATATTVGVVLLVRPLWLLVTHAGRLPDSSLRVLRRELDHEERTLVDL